MVIEGSFGLDNLKLRERQPDEPGPGEVRLRIKAVSLNRRDLMLVQGTYNPRQKLPCVPCSDGAGVIEAVGPGCRTVKTDDRAVLHFFTGWAGGEPTTERLGTALGGPAGDGTLRDTIVVPESAVLRLPESVSTEAASTLPCAALTAWAALVDHAHVAPGDTVLVQGTGGVALFALQFAKLMGARVIATTSSDAKAARLAELGADTVLRRDDPDWPRQARDAANGRIDTIIELGGESLGTSLRLIRSGGIIALIGVLGGGTTSIPLPLAVMRQVRLQGVTCGPFDSFAAMLRAIDRHGIDPVISHRFAIEESRAAFEAMEQERHVGKIVIGLD